MVSNLRNVPSLARSNSPTLICDSLLPLRKCDGFPQMPPYAWRIHSAFARLIELYNPIGLRAQGKASRVRYGCDVRNLVLGNKEFLQTTPEGNQQKQIYPPADVESLGIWSARTISVINESALPKFKVQQLKNLQAVVFAAGEVRVNESPYF